MSIPTDLVPLPTAPYDERPAYLPLDVQECRTAIWLTRGNVTKAAETLKVTSNRLRQFIKNSPFLSREVEEAREQLQDIAEDVVHEALTDETDPGRRDTMARFVLTNLGTSRGYGSGKNGVNINIPKSGKVEISWADGSSVTPRDDSDVIDVLPEAAE